MAVVDDHGEQDRAVDAGADAAVGAARAVEESGRRPLVVDLCTGSGAIAVAFAAEVPRARVIAVEIDSAAAELARENCRRHAPRRVRVLRAVTENAVRA
ncbi:methyltransferase domain-containing protein [Actinomyces oricola]|uniref:methyltransferase domain-containing protein n=1 Tax=Actinomyces oricola TaxID=206043 RepID=UPI0030C82020